MVDDDAASRLLFSEVLTLAGHHVETATDGRAALQLLENRHFDLVLCDVVMPNMGGIELLRAMRTRDTDASVLLITGVPRIESSVEAVNLGAVRYLVKPVHSSELEEAVSEAILSHRLTVLRKDALELQRRYERTTGTRTELEHDLMEVLRSLWIAYQPIVHCESAGSLFGFEALTRTDSAALPTPDAVFDAATRQGATRDLSWRVHELVAESLPRMPAGTTAFVNLHADDLADTDLFSPRGPLVPHAPSIVLEMTERTSLSMVPEVRLQVTALRAAGFRIALNDLGAGYGGLNSLASLQPEIVKLDREMIRNIDRDPLKRKITGHMIRLCEDLGVLVVAEGVETQRERTVLSNLGCDLIQGFLSGRPAPLGDWLSAC